MIQQYIPQSPGHTPHPKSASRQAPDPRRVIVDNIKAGAGKEYLELFFEKHSGGGEIENIYIDPGRGRAVVEFKEAESKK